MKSLLKSILFPGINLHARLRYKRIPKLFSSEVGKGKKVLDAGCGNGMLSYQAWRLGANVFGVSIKQKEVDGCREMFNSRKGISENELRFENVNLYSMKAEHSFDCIICTEVLEHIRDDVGICRKFFELLKPGGTVHITSPNAEHPYNVTFPLDPEEQGGHVREGYTRETYKALLEPLGFEIVRYGGVGGPIRQAFNWRIKSIQEKLGAVWGLPLFFLSLPFTFLDPEEPATPFSLYVCARKPQA